MGMVVWRAESPVGGEGIGIRRGDGIHLAWPQEKSRLTEEANKTFAQVRDRFPGYAQLADELSKEPPPAAAAKPKTGEGAGPSPYMRQPQPGADERKDYGR